MKHITHSLAIILLLATAACDGFILGGSSEDDPNNPIDPNGDGRSLEFYYGPMKLMYGETVLYSIERVTGHDFGGWDYTAPDPGTTAFNNAGNGTGQFYANCRLLGGCMEHRIPQPRTSFVGTGYVLQLERAVTVACGNAAAFGMFPDNAAPTAATQTIDIITHQFLAAFGEPPSDRDVERSIAYFTSHVADPEFTNMSPLESAGRGHCRAILSTNRFLFY